MKCYAPYDYCDCYDCEDRRIDANAQRRAAERAYEASYYEQQYQEPPEQEYPEEYVQEMVQAHVLHCLGHYGDLSVEEMARYIPASQSLPALNDLQRAGKVTGPHLRFGVARWRLGRVTKEQAR